MECIFSDIVAGKIPGDSVYQDGEVMAFRDINPKASTHLLIIPKDHIPSLAQVTSEQLPLMGHMIDVANKLAKNEGILDSGYKVVINCGRGGGQLVPHLHLHLIGGRFFFEPPL